MATLDEEFDALPDTPVAKSLNDEFDELPDAPVTAAPKAAAPAPAPAPREKTGILSTIGREMAEAVPFAPQAFGVSEKEMLEARQDRPALATAARLGTTLGEYGLASRAGPLGAGALSAAQEASALQREGKLDFSDPMTYAKLAGAGVLGAAVPSLFKGASTISKWLAPEAATPAVEAGLRRAGQAVVRSAVPVAMSVPQVQTFLSPETDTSGKYEAAANLLLLGSGPVLDARRGFARIGAERAGSIAEQAAMEAQRVIGEKQAAAGEEAFTKQLGREAEQIISQRREANKRAQREITFEQNIDVAADRLKGGAQKALGVVQNELAAQQQLLVALENATDPSLLGWRAKQFQDMANRLNSYEASWSREYPGQPLPPEFNDIRSKLDQSLMRNTQLMGSNATENFLADPDEKFAEYQARKWAEGKTKEADILQRLDAALSFANKDFNAEARAQAAARRPPLSDARRAAIYQKYGLMDPGATPSFATPPVAELASEVSRGVIGAPMRKGDLAEIYRTVGLPSGMTEADVLRAENVTPAEAARLLAEQRAAARARVEFGTTTPTPQTQRELDLSSTGRALYETAFPEAIRPDLMFRGLGIGRLRGSNVVPRTLPEYTARTSPVMSSESRMRTPFEALELASAFENLLKKDVAVDSFYRKFVERNPGATWLSFLRANPVVAAKVEAERKEASP